VLNAVLNDSGIEWDVSVTQGAGDGTRLAREAVENGVDAVGVYGGDGTIMEVIGGLIGSTVPLILLPGGTANVMSKELGIPQDLGQALALAIDGPHELKKVDLGRLDDRYFILRASLGFEADMVKGADRETKDRFGIGAYFISAWSALRSRQRARYHITVDSKQYRVSGFTCIIANSGHIGFADISMDSNIDVSDGLLDVMVVREANFSLAAHVLATLIKRERSSRVELVKHWQGREISVTARPLQTVQCDGEILGKAQLRVKTVPAAVSVIVPVTAAAR
jgi:YegS/Rv2252/BmrU family lipid kinase